MSTPQAGSSRAVERSENSIYAPVRSGHPTQLATQLGGELLKNEGTWDNLMRRMYEAAELNKHPEHAVPASSSLYVPL